MPTKLEVNFFTGFSQTPKKLKVLMVKNTAASHVIINCLLMVTVTRSVLFPL